MTEKTLCGGNIESDVIVVTLKYLIYFWRTLEMS